MHPFSAGAAAGQAHLRVLATTDLHAHVLPYDYYADRPAETLGLARTATLIAAARAGAANSLLLDNGDFLQGNPLGDHVARRGLRRGEVHPVIAAMNALGYDGATPGNHDFNYGLDFLMEALAGAAFPVVSANVARRLGARPQEDAPLLPPCAILERRLADGAGAAHPVRIGLIGLLPPQIMVWDRRHLRGRAATRDIVAAAEDWVPRLRAAGCDLILALAHSGIGPDRRADGMENAAIPLARVAGIDAVLAGHSHLVFPSADYAGHPGVDVAAGTIGGKPGVMAGFGGSHLGVIDLLLGRGDGGWRILAHRCEARPIARRGADGGVTALVESAAEVVEAVRAAHAATLAHIRRPVGRTTAPLHSYFALVADDPSLKVVAMAQARHVAERLRGTAHGHLPVLSAAAPFRAGGRQGPDFYTEVPAGDLAIRNVADLYLYPNTIRALRITGAQLQDWLERSAGIFNRIIPGLPDQMLHDPAFPSHNFDVIHGVSYRIDPSQPSRYDAEGGALNPGARRIAELAFAGRPVDPAAEFILATNNYRAAGGGDFPGAKGDTIVFEAPDTNRDILLRHILGTGTITPPAERVWGFAPLPGTSVLFDTGPRAAAYLGDLRGLAVEPAGDGPDGFARFRLRL